MDVRRTGGLMAVAAMLAVLATPASASADTSPTAAVVSPTTGTEVAGFVTVTLAGNVDPAGGDSAKSLQLYVDGDYKSWQSCASSTACTASMTWDTTALVGPHTLQARLVTAVTSVISPPVKVQVGDLPTATITSPADGASVRGKVTVNVAGTVDPLQPDAVQTLQLLVDGTTVTSSSCASGVKACLAGLVWNSTGLQGTHQLQVGLTSAKGQAVLSPVVSVQANNPVPTAILTSPAALSTVHGTVKVVALGTVDPTQVDVGASVQLLVDGLPAASVPCSAMSCPATLAWNTAGKAGIHTLQALFTTAGGRTAVSATTPVWVLSSSAVTLDRLPTATSGSSLTATGRVTAADGTGIAGAKVVVTVVSSNGKGNRKATVTADPTGRFALPYTVVSNTTVTASAQTSTHYSAGMTTTTAAALPLTSCTMATRVAKGTTDQVTCRLGSTTRGTAVALQQLKGSTWQNVASSRSSGPTWVASQVFATKGTFQLRVVLAASRDFGSVTGKTVRISVG